MSHRIDSSALLNGRVLPGTDWILRDSRAWWRRGERGTVRRGDFDLDTIVGHWTAGPCLVGPDAARRVVRNMKARKRADGTPMQVGIHFVVTWDGLVFQTCDLGLGTVHVSSREINRSSIGIETCWPGTEANARRLGVDAGHFIERRGMSILEPTEDMVRAYVRLCGTLASVLNIPRRVSVFDGHMEHFQVVGTEKVDAAGMWNESLIAAGWRCG